MNRLRWQAILMGMVILAIAGFQAYWLKDNYRREKKAVEVRTDALFHETARDLQDSLLFPFLPVLQHSPDGLIRKDPVIQQSFSTRVRGCILI
jgi:hypothetical protein